MNEYPLVQITKLSATPNCLVQPGCWDTYRVGDSNDTSVPIDYTVTGFLLAPIAVGLGVQLLRVERNGVSAVGMFLTSEVHEVTPDGFITANSVYEVRLLD